MIVSLPKNENMEPNPAKTSRQFVSTGGGQWTFWRMDQKEYVPQVSLRIPNLA